MHLLAWLGAFFAGVALLALGVLSIWRDLTARGPWEAPLVKDENGSSRYSGSETVETDAPKSFTRVR